MSVLTTMKVLRMRRQMTQTQLGELTNLYQGEISLAESGRRVRNLDLVANVLDVEDPDDLLIEWDEYRDKTRGQERELASAVA